MLKMHTTIGTKYKYLTVLLSHFRAFLLPADRRLICKDSEKKPEDIPNAYKAGKQQVKSKERIYPGSLEPKFDPLKSIPTPLLGAHLAACSILKPR